MSQLNEQDCPFCGRPATYQTKTRAMSKHIYCDNCSEFEISNFAEKQMLKATEERKKRLSELARTAPAGTYLRLARPVAESTSGATLETTFVAKSQ